MLKPFFLEDSPAHPKETGPGQQPHGKPHPPLHHIGPGKGNRPASPLQSWREIDVAGALVIEFLQGINPVRIGGDVKKSRSAESVRLEDTKDNQANHGCQE